MLSNGNKTNRLSGPSLWAIGDRSKQLNCRISRNRVSESGDMQLIRISATRTFLFTLNCRLSMDSWSFSTVARVRTFIVPSNSTSYRRLHTVYTLLCMTNTIHWTDVPGRKHHSACHVIRSHSPYTLLFTTGTIHRQCMSSVNFRVRRASVYVYNSVCIERPETKNWH